MSLYCATGGVESDLLPQLRDLFAASLGKLGREVACLRYHPIKAAFTRAPAT